MLQVDKRIELFRGDTALPIVVSITLDGKYYKNVEAGMFELSFNNGQDIALQGEVIDADLAQVKFDLTYQAVANVGEFDFDIQQTTDEMRALTFCKGKIKFVDDVNK